MPSPKAKVLIATATVEDGIKPVVIQMGEMNIGITARTFGKSVFKDIHGVARSCTVE